MEERIAVADEFGSKVAEKFNTEPTKAKPTYTQTATEIDAEVGRKHKQNSTAPTDKPRSTSNQGPASPNLAATPKPHLSANIIIFTKTKKTEPAATTPFHQPPKKKTRRKRGIEELDMYFIKGGET